MPNKKLLEPALEEMLDSSEPKQVLEIIIRLKDAKDIPPDPDIQVISQFDDVITCRIPSNKIREIKKYPSIVSIRAPRSLNTEPSLAVYTDDTECHISEVVKDPFRRSREFTGRGVVIAFIDEGIDFTSNAFLDSNGNTRFKSMWVQNAKYSHDRPNKYGYGRIYTREEINQALKTNNPFETLEYDSSNCEHGTAVCEIAAGSKRNSDEGIIQGIAHGSEDLIFVRLGSQNIGGLYNLGDHLKYLEGLEFVSEIAGNMPLVVNVCLGNTGGPHDPTTNVARAMDNYISQSSNVLILMSGGNYKDADLHTSGIVRSGMEKTFHWLVNREDITKNELEIWYSGHDVLLFGIIMPGSNEIVTVQLGEKKPILVNGVKVGMAYHRNDTLNHDNVIDVFLYNTAPAGKWKIILYGMDIADGRYHAWIERDNGNPKNQSRFEREEATVCSTIGSICDGLHTIAVGAFDSRTKDRKLASFSSCGPTRIGTQKPQLLAPGVQIPVVRCYTPQALSSKSGFILRSGTSFATPYVTGTVALMFQASNGKLTSSEIRKILLRTAEKSSDDIQCSGNGYLNIDAALSAVVENISRRDIKLKENGDSEEGYTEYLDNEKNSNHITHINNPENMNSEHTENTIINCEFSNPFNSNNLDEEEDEDILFEEKIHDYQPEGESHLPDFNNSILSDELRYSESTEQNNFNTRIDDIFPLVDKDEYIDAYPENLDMGNEYYSPGFKDQDYQLPTQFLTSSNNDKKYFSNYTSSIYNQNSIGYKIIEVVNDFILFGSNKLSSTTLLDHVIQKIRFSVSNSEIYNNITPTSLFKFCNLGINYINGINYDDLFEVVAKSGDKLVSCMTGDIFLRKLGVGFVHMAFIVSPELLDYEDLIRHNLIGESGNNSGKYVHIIELGTNSRSTHSIKDRFARKVCDINGMMLQDTAIIRFRQTNYLFASRDEQLFDNITENKFESLSEGENNITENKFESLSEGDNEFKKERKRRYGNKSSSFYLNMYRTLLEPKDIDIVDEEVYKRLLNRFPKQYNIISKDYMEKHKGRTKAISFFNAANHLWKNWGKARDKITSEVVKEFYLEFIIHKRHEEQRIDDIVQDIKITMLEGRTNYLAAASDFAELMKEEYPKQVDKGIDANTASSFIDKLTRAHADQQMSFSNFFDSALGNALQVGASFIPGGKVAVAGLKILNNYIKEEKETSEKEQADYLKNKEKLKKLEISSFIRKIFQNMEQGKNKYEEIVGNTIKELLTSYGIMKDLIKNKPEEDALHFSFKMALYDILFKASEMAKDQESFRLDFLKGWIAATRGDYYSGTYELYLLIHLNPRKQWPIAFVGAAYPENVTKGLAEILEKKNLNVLDLNLRTLAYYYDYGRTMDDIWKQGYVFSVDRNGTVGFGNYLSLDKFGIDSFLTLITPEKVDELRRRFKNLKDLIDPGDLASVYLFEDFIIDWHKNLRAFITLKPEPPIPYHKIYNPTK